MPKIQTDLHYTGSNVLVKKRQLYALLVDGAGAPILDVDGNTQLIEATAGTDGKLIISASLLAGAAIAGKVGIDQTTDGTTNKVVAKISQAAGENNVILSGSYLVQDAVIAKDGTESTEVDIQKWKYISILMPDGWDAATLTIKGSAVSGGTKRTIKNDVGQTFPAMTVAVDTIYSIDANALMLAGVFFISFVASAAQTTAARTIKVMCKA